MQLYRLNNTTDAKALVDTIGVDSGGKTILIDKMHHHLIKIEKLHVAAANILKQDALSIGADVVVPKGVITCDKEYVDVVLIASNKHLKALSKKELAQPFGLKEVAKQLKAFTMTQKNKAIKIMGVINANDDSFFSASRFSDLQAIDKILEMIDEGADSIDIGAVSSRPGSEMVDADEELIRIAPILQAIHSHKLYEKVEFSIDSYTPSVIQRALDTGFSVVNDITGLRDDAVCKLVAEYDAQAVIMHMQGTPQSMQKSPYYENVIVEVDHFFTQQIAKAESLGVKDIVLDVGIGFGKRLEDNLALIKHMEHFLHLHKPLLIGASRKSMIDHIKPTPVEERLPATLLLHFEAVRNGASIIRCHDVKAHVDALSAFNALQED